MVKDAHNIYELMIAQNSWLIFPFLCVVAVFSVVARVGNLDDSVSGQKGKDAHGIYKLSI